MLGALADSRRVLPLSLWKRRLLGTVVVGAFPLAGGLTLPEPAWGQASATLPEVTVTAPRPAPKPASRATPARAAPAAARPARAPPETPAPTPAALPAYQLVAPTPLTGIGFDRSKVPAMVQTLPAEDFSRVYSPNVVETLMQRIPGVSTNGVQGNEFATDLRYRGFSASPVQGTPWPADVVRSSARS